MYGNYPTREVKVEARFIDSAWLSENLPAPVGADNTFKGRMDHYLSMQWLCGNDPEGEAARIRFKVPTNTKECIVEYESGYRGAKWLTNEEGEKIRDRDFPGLISYEKLEGD